MDFSVTTEPKENRQLAMTIEVPKQRVEKELQKAAQRVSQQYGVPGFRKGKAPFQVIVRHFGLSNLYGEFADNLLQEYYPKALEGQEIKPYATGQLEKIDFEPTLTYRLVVPLEPVVKLGDYRSLRVAEEQIEIADERIDEQLERIRDNYSDWQEVTRPAAFGDSLAIDIHSKIVTEDGSEGATVLDENDWDVTLDEENRLEPPGLDTEIIGMSVGESKEFDLAWPADSKSVNAGKTAHFTVTVNKVKAYAKADLNDELAQKVNEEFKTLADLRENIRQNLANQEKTRADNQYVDKALDAVLEISELDFPPVVIEDQLDGMVDDYKMRLRQLGIQDIEWYFQQIGKNEAEFREGMREDATLVARRNLVLSEILTTEKLAVSDEEIEQRIIEITTPRDESQREQMEQVAASFRTNGRSILMSQLLREKGLARLLDIVRGKPVPEPGAEESATAEAAVESPVTEEKSADE